MSNFKNKAKNAISLILSIFLLLAFSIQCDAQKSSTKLVELCNEFNRLNSNIRDNKIKKPLAKEQVIKLIEQIRNEYYSSGGQNYTTKDWVFPLKGYGYKAIGGVSGNGYQKNGYDYFDGNKHSGHPALDIFIHDKKQYSIDDVTKKPVSVLSVTGGVVVAVEKDWDKSSLLRGGKYIWIYDPSSNALIYYAHNSVLHVEVGDLIKPGDDISYVGRTGINAYKQRSPTHLHLSYLSILKGLPIPRNIYKELLTSKLR
jgi:hypothetical protein